ncbi:MAG: hypothetical protein JW987_13435 [Anaerolineaceae bacterium]|nr:hypothetical protein [Anaerolineaceae bacterium]
MPEETVSQAQKRVDVLEAEYRTIKARLEDEIASSEKSGFEPETTTLKAKLAGHEGRYITALTKARASLEAIKNRSVERESESSRLLEEARASQEAELKERASLKWQAAGGSSVDFEQAWPAIRAQMLTQMVLGQIAGNAASRRSIKF